MRNRFWTSFTLLTAVAVGSLLGIAPSAHAATGDLACVINFQFNFDPPLTATNTTGTATTASAGFVDCTSPNGSYPSLTSGLAQSVNADVTSSSGPCNLIITITGDGTVAWNTGQVSHFDFTVNTDPLNGNITISADVTSGPLTGDSITAAPVVAHPNLDCALNGLKTLTADVGLVAIG